jgi:transposase
MPRPGKPVHLQVLAGSREDRINRNAPLPADRYTAIKPPYPLSDLRLPLDGGHLIAGPLVLLGGCSRVGKPQEVHPGVREQAVRLVVDTGRPIAHVAAEIGVGEQLLGRWVAAAKARSDADNPEVLDDDERAELQRLRKENAELRLDRAFLKKAASFFASEQNR